MTALHYAAESARIKIVKYLIEQQATINIQAHNGVSLYIRSWQTLCRNWKDTQYSKLLKQKPYHVTNVHDSLVRRTYEVIQKQQGGETLLYHMYYSNKWDYNQHLDHPINFSII